MGKSLTPELLQEVAPEIPNAKIQISKSKLQTKAECQNPNGHFVGHRRQESRVFGPRRNRDPAARP
jgi:hypothetical protein